MAKFGMKRKFIQVDCLHSSHFNENFFRKILLFAWDGDTLDLEMGRLEASLEEDDAFTFSLQGFYYGIFERIKMVKDFITEKLKLVTIMIT